MSDIKHTPAPWLIRKCGVRTGEGLEHVICAFDDYMITSRGESDGNEKADARLIAAAPDLYETVKRVDALLRDIEDVCLAMPHARRPRWFRGVQDMIAATSSAIRKVDGK